MKIFYNLLIIKELPVNALDVWRFKAHFKAVNH